MTPPRIFSALPPPDLYEASPKAISRRTSYLRVRLEFLPYPHLITTLFNGCVFGPPSPFTATSTWTWIDHPVSGLPCLTSRAFNACFHSGSALSVLNLAGQDNSPDRSTKSTRFPLKAGSTACRHRVSGSLSLPSRGSFHLSFTVLCAIGHSEYLALGGGPPSFPQNFTCIVVLRILPAASAFRIRGFHPLWRSFPEASALHLPALCSPYPGVLAPRFGLLRFRSPLLTESMFLSFPPPT